MTTTTGYDAIACRKRVVPPINLERWIAEYGNQLAPPVGNKYLYDGDGFFVMVIAGPNARNDFHVSKSEEYFYQLKGNIVVRVIEDDSIKSIPVLEGETFFIPGGVPHSPTRPPGTIGLVVELRRPPGETEHLQFYCESCSNLVRDMEFDCADIVRHFARAMEEFWADPNLSTCNDCGTRVAKPTPIKRIIFEPSIIIERE